MYIPPSFAETDPAVLRDFIDGHGFATLVSQGDGEPFATHLPLLRITGDDGCERLWGHFARANPHAVLAAGQRVLAIFHGPHQYISPTWYESPNTVPTWNYIAVHAYGVLREVADRDRLRDIIDRLVVQYEAPQPQPWSAELADGNFSDKLLDAVVGFEIVVDRLEGKWKLNQNHDVARRERVIRVLEQAKDDDSRAIAAAMRRSLGAK